MGTVPRPGVSEVGWLADLKEVAETAGQLVYQERIRWDVEGLESKSRRRPDVIIRRDRNGEILASGEAKRPDEPRGVHPLVATEIRDAIGKAQLLGAPLCFTTNFFEAAIFDASNRTYATDLDRLQGAVIPLVPETEARSPDWWMKLSAGTRNDLVFLGLRVLFERLRQASQMQVPREVDEAALLVFSRTTQRLLTPLFHDLVAARDAGEVPVELKRHALAVGLRISEDAEARYLIAQGIAEVLTAVLFYRNISDHFSLGPLLRGTNPRLGKTLQQGLSRSFQNAIAMSGDYEPIFGLSPAAQWVILRGGQPVLQHWKDLLGFVDQLDFSSVSSDVMGSIFERLISPERRHAMGQHYTDARIARAMVKWAIASSADRIADVACGAGTFLVEAYKVLGKHGLTHTQLCSQLFGNDIDPFAVHLATMNLATRDIYRGSNYPAVRRGDAFEVLPGGTVIEVRPAHGDALTVRWPAKGLDSVVGNPPYAEKPESVSSLVEHLQKLGLEAPRGMRGGNLAIWFALLACGLVRKGGRIALVLPTSALQNDNARLWRSWMRTHCDLTVWHTEDDVWFSDARVAVCVVLARRSDESEEESGRQRELKFVDVREATEGNLLLDGGTPTPAQHCTVRDLAHLPGGDDILIAGTYPEPLQRFARLQSVCDLAVMPGITVASGNKLGHPCFQLRDEEPMAKGLLRNVTGYEMGLRLSQKYLVPLFVSPKDERTGEFQQSECWVLSAPEVLPSSGALRDYIAHCESLGVHQQPSVRNRGREWWAVEWRRCQVAVQIHPGFLHQVWWSKEPFVAKNNFHVLEFDDAIALDDRELIAASLASGFGALSALYISSEVGCEGVRWLSTEQFCKWPVLMPSEVRAVDKTLVLKEYRRFREIEAVELQAMDATTLGAFARLTEVVAQAAGMPSPDECAQEVVEYARQTCVRRESRERIALAGRTRGGATGTGTFGKLIKERLEADPRTARVLEGLTTGEKVVRLRGYADLAQQTLGLEPADGRSMFDEEALSSLLGAGFECAPSADAGNSPTLQEDISGLLTELLGALLGEPPRPSDPATSAYEEGAGQVRKVVIGWLQRQVRLRLR